MFLIIAFAVVSFALQRYFGWYSVGALYGTIFAWQLLADQLKWTLFKPSVAMLGIAKMSNRLAAWSGRQFARLSSFLAIIEWSALLTTVTNLAEPFILAAQTPWTFLKGYGAQAVKYAGAHKKDLLVYLGSAIVIVLSIRGLVYGWPIVRPYVLEQCQVYFSECTF